MKNIGNMMRQAQEMQQRLGDMQKALANVFFEGFAGGDAVKVVLNGSGVATAVNIKPAIVDVADLSVLEDLLVAAFNDARAKIEKHVEGETQKIMGGMALPPGFKLPF